MKDNSGFIRPLAICVFSRNGKILACFGKDDVKKEEYYRPIGGMIEFGETGEEALIREVMEETSAEIKNLKYLGTLENIFTYLGKPHHEIVMVYDAEFTDEELYDRNEIEINEANTWNKSYWLPIEDCRAGKYILYPEGLPDLLR